MIEKLKGTGVALITPFLESGAIDFDSLEKLVDNAINCGVDYLVTLCTTSETPTLSDAEKELVVKKVREVNNHRVPIVRGLGGYNTAELVHQLHTLDFTDIDALLSVAPYYNKPSQNGLFLHYKTLADNSPIPIILYNVQGRTGCNIEANTTLKLAQNCPNIIAIKEASGNMNQIMKVIAHKPDNFSVISGDDAITLPLIAAGADGLISVVANAFPKQVSSMVRLARNNQFPEARKIHLQLLDYTQTCFKEGNPAGIKMLLALQGKIQHFLRLPLAPASENLEHDFNDLLKNNIIK